MCYICFGTSSPEQCFSSDSAALVWRLRFCISNKPQGIPVPLLLDPSFSSKILEDIVNYQMLALRHMNASKIHFLGITGWAVEN